MRDARGIHVNMNFFFDSACGVDARSEYKYMRSEDETGTILDTAEGQAMTRLLNSRKWGRQNVKSYTGLVKRLEMMRDVISDHFFASKITSRLVGSAGVRSDAVELTNA